MTLWKNLSSRSARTTAATPLKEAVRRHLEAEGYLCRDFGTHSEDSVDYPDMAVAPCEAVLRGECDKALLFCGTGVGISMAANKIRGIRACCCSDAFSARYTRLHNDANALCMGGARRGAGPRVRAGRYFPFHPRLRAARHAKRVAKLMALEE